MRYEPHGKENMPTKLDLMDCIPGEVYEANWHPRRAEENAADIEDLRLCMQDPDRNGKIMVRLDNGRMSSRVQPGRAREYLYVHRPDVYLTGEDL